MNTTADKLELLLRTKERQKACLQEKYPLLDFDTIPFRAYLDLFQGRSYVPGFVGGWKAYGRSNDEPDGQRNFLRDYSGNGRDIELFNFAFAGMSGYGGYPQDLSLYNRNDSSLTLTKTATRLDISIVTAANDVLLFLPVADYSKKAMKLRITSSVTLNSVSVIIYKIDWTIAYSQELSTTGVTTMDVIPDKYLTNEYNENIYLRFAADTLPVGTTVTVELLPDYPGALVSDGIDDYGQCIKGFALPDDYTVVAVRKILKGNNGGLATKGWATKGAFLFEAGDVSVPTWSFGASTSIPLAKRPALFSYQSKASYNGVALNVGDNVDNESNKLMLFTQSSSSSNRQSVALYDLRIYDHSLTAEELQTVKDEMMSDYENATGGV